MTWIGCVERLNSVTGTVWTITYCFRSSSVSNTRCNHKPLEKQNLGEWYSIVTLLIILMLLTNPHCTWQFHPLLLNEETSPCHLLNVCTRSFRVLLWIITELICGVCAGVSSISLLLIKCDTLISDLNIPVLISVGFGSILKLPIKTSSTLKPNVGFQGDSGEDKPMAILKQNMAALNTYLLPP